MKSGAKASRHLVTIVVLYNALEGIRRLYKGSEGSIKALETLCRLKTVTHNALSLNRSSHEGVITIYFPQGAARRVVAQTAWRRVSACSEYVCFCGPLSMSTHTLNGRVGGCGGCGESG